MPDETKWDVPVKIIALNRAEHYKHEYEGSVIVSLDEDTEPLFTKYPSEIKEWASDNMNWS